LQPFLHGLGRSRPVERNDDLTLAARSNLGYYNLPSSRNVRVLLYGHYRIAYLVKDDGNIDILGVFHSALDITRYQL
jgi:plasmid stabilization system protein ParE